MFGLSDQVGGDELRIAVIGKDDGFGGAASMSMAQSALTRRLAAVTKRLPGAEDFIDARNRTRAVSESGNGLRATDARDFYAQTLGGSEKRGPGLRADDNDFAHARFLRGHDGHQQCGNEREAAAGKIAADRVDGADALTCTHARLNFDVPFKRLLLFCHGANVARGVIDGREKIRGDFALRFFQFDAGYPDIFRAERHTIEALGVAKSEASPRRRTSSTMREAARLFVKLGADNGIMKALYRA